MQLTEAQEQGLRRVLDQLMTSYKASAEELSATHAYMFGERAMAPFFTDKELFETVLYLRETVLFQELADLDALIRYYEGRKQEMCDYLTEIATTDGIGGKDEAVPAVGAYQLRIEDNMAVTSTELDQLTRQINTEAGRFFETLYTKIIQFFESSPLPAAGEKDVHSAVKKHVRELVLTDKPVSVQWQSLRTTLPCGIKHYVEQFASHFNGEQIVIMQFGNRLAGSMQRLSSGDTDWLAHVYDGTIGRHFFSGHSPDYAAIMNVLRREEPIMDSYFKIQLTEWLVYSKLIISDCQNDEPKQYSPGRMNISLTQLFQGAEVRVYGCSNMHYWIHNLFQAKLSLKRWVILKRRPGHFWLTSDNPGFLININDLQGGFTEVVPRHSLLDIRPDSVLYYPLSKDYCLKLEPDVELRDEGREDMPIDYETPPDDEQDFVNGVTVSTYKKVVITNQRTTLQQIQI